MIHDLTHAVHDGFHLSCWHVAGFADIMGTADGDVGIHVFHFRELVFGDDGILVIGGTDRHFTGDAAIFKFNDGDGFFGTDFADQAEANFLWHIKQVEHDFFTFFDRGGVMDELAGELGNTWILHKF